VMPVNSLRRLAASALLYSVEDASNHFHGCKQIGKKLAALTASLDAIKSGSELPGGHGKSASPESAHSIHLDGPVSTSDASQGPQEPLIYLGGESQDRLIVSDPNLWPSLVNSFSKRKKLTISTRFKGRSYQVVEGLRLTLLDLHNRSGLKAA
jgi:hypothetical protein